MTKQEVENNVNTVLSALKGERGAEQIEVAIAGFQLLALVLHKNADYGGSALKPPVMSPGTVPQAALRCRMSDKLQRVIKLSTSNPEVATEGIDDAIDDLAGYGILDKVLRNRASAIEEAVNERDSETPGQLETPPSHPLPSSPVGADAECDAEEDEV